VIDVVRDVAEYIPLEKGMKLSAEQLLERFLFPRPQQQVYISQLSGGEKRRLYLLTILITNPNFLILDEPTNDLDIITLNILEDYLMEFPGCLVIITHDRYFMDKLTDHIFILEGEGKVKDFNGSYSEWKARQQISLEESRNTSDNFGSQPKEKKTKKAPEQIIKNNVKRIEKKISDKEKIKAKYSEELNENLDNLDKINELSVKIGEVVKEINALEEEWEEWVEQL
jgi:ATP-binding cassette subfamily F protein uup